MKIVIAVIFLYSYNNSGTIYWLYVFSKHEVDHTSCITMILAIALWNGDGTLECKHEK